MCALGLGWEGGGSGAPWLLLCTALHMSRMVRWRAQVDMSLSVVCPGPMIPRQARTVACAPEAPWAPEVVTPPPACRCCAPLQATRWAEPCQAATDMSQGCSSACRSAVAADSVSRDCFYNFFASPFFGTPPPRRITVDAFYTECTAAAPPPPPPSAASPAVSALAAAGSQRMRHCMAIA